MKRKLTAILYADVAGFVGLMAADEAGTLERLKFNRASVFDPTIRAHGGRLIKLMGDGALVEFASVVAAVECALAIQSATEVAAASQQETHRVRYRIGVNVGEVIVEGDDLYGDGINVAARLQTIAPIGGVALSRSAMEQVAGKIACPLHDLGEQRVKDHDPPLHAFLAGEHYGRVRSKLSQAPTKPSICVLPFANISGEIEQDYFSDGISEDITTNLAKISALSVVARNTAFQFKGKALDMGELAGKLAVSHLLEGSVRKAGGRVRITAQLIEGASGNQIWAERYDRELSDIFALQDEIAAAIVDVLKLQLLPAEKKAIARRGTEDVEAYELYLLARHEYLSGWREQQLGPTVVRLCEAAVRIDPIYAHAHALMGLAQAVHAAIYGGNGEEGRAAAVQALSIDPGLAEAHALMARLLANSGRLEEASREISLAFELDPEPREVIQAAVVVARRKGRFAEAVALLDKIIAIDEFDLAAMAQAMACRAIEGDLDAAKQTAALLVERAEKLLVQDRNNVRVLSTGGRALAFLGQIERAQEWHKRAFLFDPDNLIARVSFAGTQCLSTGDEAGALDTLEVFFERTGPSLLATVRSEPLFARLGKHPRFASMLAGAELRLRGQRQD